MSESLSDVRVDVEVQTPDGVGKVCAVRGNDLVDVKFAGGLRRAYLRSQLHYAKSDPRKPRVSLVPVRVVDALPLRELS